MVRSKGGKGDLLKPSTCPHASEMGALREVARDNIYDERWPLIEQKVTYDLFSITNMH